MRRVLIIAFYFPPYNTIGAIRPGKFAKFLPQFGWEPWVLTVPMNFFPGLNDLPVELDESHIVRIGYMPPLDSFFKKRWLRKSSMLVSATSISSWQSVLSSTGRLVDLILPDRETPWYPTAIHAGLALTKRVSYDAVLSTAGPPACHIVASWIVRRRHLPWVADYRDLWSLNYISLKTGFWRKWDSAIEREVLHPAECLLTVSDPLAHDLSNLHYKPTRVITNGFDQDDYTRDVSPLRQFTLTYTGSLYPPHRDPSVLFEALAEMRAEGLSSSDIQIRFFCSQESVEFAKTRASEFGVEDFVTFGGRINYALSLRRQQESTALLLFELTEDSAAGVLTGKLFEYLGAGRPVLAIGPPGGAIAHVLEETKAGSIMQTVREVKLQLRSWLDIFKRTGTLPFTGDALCIVKYSREQQSRQLALILDQVAR